jgi:sulfoxide reductase heme-binding subunit YedZ
VSGIRHAGEAEVSRPLAVGADRSPADRLSHGGRRVRQPRWRAVVQVGVHAGALVPLAMLIGDSLTGGLTANPIQALTARTGTAALVCLVLSLAVTPFSGLGRQAWVVPWRRPLGLYAFFYASLHMATFVALDYGLDWYLIRDTVLEKRYIVAGSGAFVAMVPLALTSTRGWQRRLGTRWRKLHRLAYLAAILAVIHFLWLVKADIRQPVAYGVGVAALLALRLPGVRSRLRSW